MERNLENYLTAQEKKKVDEIISRAMKRREENGWKEEQQPFQQPFEFVVINCQCQEAQEEQQKGDIGGPRPGEELPAGEPEPEAFGWSALKLPDDGGQLPDPGVLDRKIQERAEKKEQQNLPDNDVGGQQLGQWCSAPEQGGGADGQAGQHNESHLNALLPGLPV